MYFLRLVIRSINHVPQLIALLPLIQEFIPEMKLVKDDGCVPYLRRETTDFITKDEVIRLAKLYQAHAVSITVLAKPLGIPLDIFVQYLEIPEIKLQWKLKLDKDGSIEGSGTQVEEWVIS